jgi:hypothetical protein
MSEDGVIDATRILQGVGKNRHSVEGTFVVDAAG